MITEIEIKIENMKKIITIQENQLNYNKNILKRLEDKRKERENIDKYHNEQAENMAKLLSQEKTRTSLEEELRNNPKNTIFKRALEIINEGA